MLLSHPGCEQFIVWKKFVNRKQIEWRVPHSMSQSETFAFVHVWCHLQDANNWAGQQTHYLYRKAHPILARNLYLKFLLSTPEDILPFVFFSRCFRTKFYSWSLLHQKWRSAMGRRWSCSFSLFSCSAAVFRGIFESAVSLKCWFRLMKFEHKK